MPDDALPPDDGDLALVRPPHEIFDLDAIKADARAQIERMVEELAAASAA